MIITFTARKGIPVKAWRTLAFVTARKILTNGINSTGRFVSKFRTFIGVSTFASFRVPHVTSLTYTNTLPNKFILNTYLGSRAWKFCTTLCRSFRLRTSFSEWVSTYSTGALTRKRSRFVVTHCSWATRITLTFINICTSGV